tara:strand:+ start:250 stop:1005 length:756 start_codon:yes stop_codon:yes gene_type:complete
MSLYDNINKRKKAGTSRSKENSTISKKNYKDMQDGFPNSKKNRGAYIKKKKFKPHMMYDKNGKSYKANTMQEHLDMKKKGYGHSKKGAYMKKDMGYAMGKKKKKKFPDLNKDGKVTYADVLKGRGVSKGAYMHAMKKKIGMNAGSKVYSGTVSNTRDVANKMDIKDGMYRQRQILSVPAEQVGGSGGQRYYLGEGSSRQPGIARRKASSRARVKMVSAPQDSIPSAMIPAFFDEPKQPEKKKKRKGFFRRK